jgi:putative DNA primase/helicase
VAAGRHKSSVGDQVDDDDITTEIAIVAAAMAVIPNNEYFGAPNIENWEFNWDSWNRIGMAIWRASNGSEEGFAIFDEWSQKNSNRYNTRMTRKKWEVYHTTPPDQISYGSIRWLANKADPDWERRYDRVQEDLQRQAILNARARRRTAALQQENEQDYAQQQQGTQQQDNTADPQQDATDATNEEEVVAPLFSDDAIAFQFTIEHADALRYVAPWGKWMFWDKTHWCVDDTRLVFSLARDMCRIIANACTARAERKRIASARTRAAVVSLAGDDRLHSSNIDQWDSDPWLLNTPKGVVDLHTGKLQPHRPDNYITHITAVSPADNCNLWYEFLNKITAGDKDLKSYLQRVCGYVLTGLTHEHALFFLHGLGANGKGTFINAIAGVLNDYHRSTPIETFTATNVDRHPTELADLRAARLVTATETEEGRRWAESRIKMLTGGDRVKARFMRQDFFEYIPQFKLMISGNHKPGIRSVDEAIKRRFNLVPFNVIIPKDERDKNLGEKLRIEWPGILNWMIDGCLFWQRYGLTPPTSVMTATQNYFADEDIFETWLEECCIKNPSEWNSVTELFHCWEQWTQAHGEFTGTSKRFSQRLTESGFEPRRGHERGFGGLTLYTKDPTTQQRKRIWEKIL